MTITRSFLSAFVLSLFSCTALWAMEKEEKEEGEDHKNIVHVLHQIDEVDSSGAFIIPEGALDNKEPFELKTPVGGFEERVKDVILQQNTLRSLGMDPTPQNQQAYFSKPQELAQYLKQNLWGPELLLEKVSFQTPQELLILDAVGKTRSLRRFSLKGAFLKSDAYLALAYALSRNASLKGLDLTGVSCSLNDLTLLGYALSQQRSLREMKFNAKLEAPLTEDNIKHFYEQIKTNTGLRLIIWPGFEEPEKAQQFKKTGWTGCKSILEVIQKLSDTNRVAALHRALMFKLGIGEEKNLSYALGYLELAHKLGHPLAAYEIAKLYEKEAQDHKKALEWLNQSTEEGNPMAFVKRGDYYRQIEPWNRKLPLEKIDYEAAFQNYKIAADHGHRQGLYKLGKMYESGRHVQKDLDKAAELFFESCQCGYPDAFTALGALYNNPAYSQYNENDKETSKYYLNWGTSFAESRATAIKLLSYVEQDEKQPKNKDDRGKEDK